MALDIPDEVTREQLIDSLNASNRYIRSILQVIDRLLDRSPIDTQTGACGHCRIYAGTIEVRGKVQYVPRHTDDCPYKIALALFAPAPTSNEGVTDGTA